MDSSMDMGAPMMDSSMDMGVPMIDSSMDMGAPMMDSSMHMDSNDDSNDAGSWRHNGPYDLQCLPYIFLTGVDAGSSNGCWQGRVLSSIS